MPFARVPQAPRILMVSRSRAFFALMLAALVLLTSCAAPGATPPSSGQSGKAASGAVTFVASKPFDPSIGAPLPNYRIVAAYGFQGTGYAANGPASSIDMLTNYLPQLQQLGQQYAALDPTHPVKLAVDLVVQTFAPCSIQYCNGWFEAEPDDLLQNNTLASYINFCQQHNMLLFLDIQLGTEPVQHALTTPIAPAKRPDTALTYLEKFPFVELHLDTEFHFPNTQEGYSLAAQYDPGAMPASELNWAINALAQIPQQYHVPRKILVTDQWYPGVFNLFDVSWSSDASSQKKDIKPDPNVSLVLQSDGFGSYDNKIGDYQAFVQQDLLEYGGYKLFFYYQGANSYDYADISNPTVQTPQQVMQLFPQPLYISYQ